MSIFDNMNPEQAGLFEKRVVLPYMKETFLLSKFARYMGNSSSNLIYTEQQNKGAGEEIVFAIDQTYFPNVKFNEQQLVGSGDTLLEVTDRVRIGTNRFAVAASGIDLDEIKVKINITDKMRQSLRDKGAMTQTCKALNQFAFSFVGDAVRNDYHTFYSYYPDKTGRIAFYDYFTDKIKSCGVYHSANKVVNAAGTISTDRVVFGNNVAPQDTIGASITDARLPLNAGHTLTVDHIWNLAQLATKGSHNLNGESPLVPASLAVRFGYDDPKFTLFTSPSGFGQLRKDAEWIAQSRRAIIENSKEQPSIYHNSMYQGSIYGVDVIVVPEFEHLSVLNSDNTKIVYSALCGQSAIVMGMGMAPRFTEAKEDHDMFKEIGVTHIDGAKPLKFSSKSDVSLAGINPLKIERGIIHSFTRAV